MSDRVLSEPPLSLEGLAAGVDLLDAVLVFHLSDARLYAVWVRPESGLRAEDVVTTLRDFYRVGQFVARRLGVPGMAAGSPIAQPSPVLTLELEHRTATLRKVRAHVVACVFDAAMPLGMARLIGDRVTAALEPELPLNETLALVHAPSAEGAKPAPNVASGAAGTSGASGASGASRASASPTDGASTERGTDRERHEEQQPVSALRPGSTWAPQPPHATIASPRIAEEDGSPDERSSEPLESGHRAHVSSSAPRPDDRSPATLSFGSSLPRRSRPPPAPSIAERLARLIAHLEAHAPEPHVARVRVALRAGLTVAALDKPELLGPEVVVLVETAVQDILGIDRAELRRIA